MVRALCLSLRAGPQQVARPGQSVGHDSEPPPPEETKFTRFCFSRRADGETALPRIFPAAPPPKNVQESGPTFEIVGYLQTFPPRGSLKVKPAAPHPPGSCKGLGLSGHPGLTG